MSGDDSTEFMFSRLLMPGVWLSRVATKAITDCAVQRRLPRLKPGRVEQNDRGKVDAAD